MRWCVGTDDMFNLTTMRDGRPVLDDVVKFEQFCEGDHLRRRAPRRCGAGASGLSSFVRSLHEIVSPNPTLAGPRLSPFSGPNDRTSRLEHLVLPSKEFEEVRPPQEVTLLPCCSRISALPPAARSQPDSSLVGCV
jgi:hypothetical protein